MQLDSSRNHIIMVNLWLSIVNISVMGTTILPAFFGMNLSSGLSDTDPFFFYMVRATAAYTRRFRVGLTPTILNHLLCVM
jgi:hypothetical protein